MQQEIKFWKSKMAAIERLESQLKTPGVCASTLVLMKNNYVVQARAFLNRVQIKEIKKKLHYIMKYYLHCLLKYVKKYIEKYI